MVALSSARYLARSFGLLLAFSLVLPVFVPTVEAQAAPVVHAPHVTEVFSRDGAVDVAFTPARHPVDTDDTWSVTVTAAPGGRTAVVSDPTVASARVTGLANGTTYTFTAVETLNGISSAASTKSPPVKPRAAGRPHAPTIDSVLGRSGRVVVRWNPAPDHGAPITGYTVTAQPANTQVTVAGTVYEAALTGLTNGRAQKVTVTATNKAGAGKPSKEVAGTPRVPYPPLAPESVSVAPPTSGNPGVLDVMWHAPVDNGGQAITSYTVKANPGGKTTTVAGTQTKATLTGLDPAVLYTVTVTAANGVANPAPAAGTAKAKAAFTAHATTAKLTAASLAAVTKVTRHRVVFDPATPQVKGLKVGAVIVAEPRQPTVRKGLLRKITNIAVSGERVVLTTVDAKLQDAIANSTAHVAPPPNWIAGGQARSLVPDVRVLSEEIGGRLSLDFQYKPQSNSSDGSKLQAEAQVDFSAALTGEVSITPEWDLNVDMGWFSLNSASITAAATIRASLDGKFTAHFSGTAEPTTPIVEYRFSCFTFWIGWFPVVVCPVFTLNARVSADGSLEFTFTASYEQKFGGSLTYRDGNVTPTNLTTDPVTTFDPQLEAEITLAAELPAKLELLLYGLAGPELTVTPGVKFNANPSRTPWGTIALTIDVSVGLTVPLLGLEYEESVFSYDKPVWESTDSLTIVDVTPHAIEIGSGTTTQFAGRPIGCANTAPITWSLAPGAKGTIDDTTGLYTAPASGSSHDKVIATKASTTTCRTATGHGYVLSGPTVPSAPRNLQAQKTGENYQLSWLAPADTGRQPVSYVVKVCKHAAEDDVCVLNERTTGTSYTLVPDTESEVHRAVTIIAYNAAGTGVPSEPLELE